MVVKAQVLQPVVQQDHRPERQQWPPQGRLASFPGRRRNGLATSASSNCCFRCLKVGSTNPISERSHMTTVELSCVMQ